MFAETDIPLNSTSNKTSRLKKINSMKSYNILKMGIPFFGVVLYSNLKLYKLYKYIFHVKHILDTFS